MRICNLQVARTAFHFAIRAAICGRFPEKEGVRPANGSTEAQRGEPNVNLDGGATRTNS